MEGDAAETPPGGSDVSPVPHDEYNHEHNPDAAGHVHWADGEQHGYNNDSASHGDSASASYNEYEGDPASTMDEDEYLEMKRRGPPPPAFRVWRPSASYRYTMRDITEQYTPGENYRHQLATAGKEQRILQRLEWRWRRDLPLWTKCATTVKAGYRGMLGRRQFNKVKAALTLKLTQRRCRAAAVDAFYSGDTTTALEAIASVPQMTRELYIIKFKILHIIAEYQQCEDGIRAYLGE